MSLSCTSSNVEKDLSMICEEANKVNQDTSLSEDEKFIKVIRTTYPLLSSRRTKGLFEYLAIKSDSPTYSEFETLASDNGIETWSCEVLKALLEEEPLEEAL